MKTKPKVLLMIDAFVNLVLGILLLLFLSGVLTGLGLPPTDTFFYTAILGAVIFGIGVALCIELWGTPRGLHGLGLFGAIVINVCGGSVLLAWLIFGQITLPLHGQVTLWSVVIIVLGLGIVEMVDGSWRQAG